MQVVEPQCVISPAGTMDRTNAAVYLGVRPETIYNLHRTKQIRAKKVGRELLFFKDDLDEYLKR